MENHKNHIIPIIQVIILCGKQNVALRENRNSGKIFVCPNSKMNIEGSFRKFFVTQLKVMVI